MIKKYVCVTLCCILLSFFSLLSAQKAIENTKFGALISDYLKDSAARFNFEDSDISELVVNNEYYSENTDIIHVYVNQTYQGIRILNGISSVAIKNGAVFYYANRFINSIDKKVKSTIVVYSPSDAIQKLAIQLELGSLQNLQQLERNTNRYVFSDAGIASESIPVELVYVNIENELKLAWDIIVYTKDNKKWWNVQVDVLTNEVLDIHDFILTCTFEKEHKHSEHATSIDFQNEMSKVNSMLVDGSNYNVFALPTESPSHGSRQVVSNPASTKASPFGWHDVNGIAGAEYIIARGNNVNAKEDALGDNSLFGFSPNGGSALNFNFPLDFNLAPTDYKAAAITNLFYLNNMMHDIWFNHGFDEASGNFQAKNYSNIGEENDFVLADAQDGSRFNNANFGTGPDGVNPRMQMFLWSPPGVSIVDQVNILNGSIAGEYTGLAAAFGMALPTTEALTGSLALAIDATDNIYDSCQPLTNTATINGNIAILRRGDCQFGFKVLSVQNAGAIAAIIVNNVPGALTLMSPGDDGSAVSIPSIMISQALGESLISALENGEIITADLLGPDPDLTDFIDGDFDNGIIAHEYGHGISNRLTGGPLSASCLSNDEQMGEGWSDWFGLMVTLKASDLPEDARGIGTFSTSQPVSGGGIRPAPYSTDFAENNFTYRATNTLTRPHGIGFVWATVLWDLTWAYIDKYGFDADLYSGGGGNNRIMKLVIDGLKLQPCNPGFVDGRDAILAADMATTGGVDQCMIWDVFAARGLGVNADQGFSSDRADQIENFDLPLSTDSSLANCSSLSVDEFSEDTLSIYPNPTQTEVSISTRKNLGTVTVTLIDINGRVVLEMRQELFNVITVNTGQLQSGLYILNIKGDNFNFNEKIIKN